jgi:hypothetical protein
MQLGTHNFAPPPRYLAALNPARHESAQTYILNTGGCRRTLLGDTPLCGSDPCLIRGHTSLNRRHPSTTRPAGHGRDRAGTHHFVGLIQGHLIRGHTSLNRRHPSATRPAGHGRSLIRSLTGDTPLLLPDRCIGAPPPPANSCCSAEIQGAPCVSLRGFAASRLRVRPKVCRARIR